MTISVEDYVQPVGSTRDCQNRRLTETVYVDVTDILRRCFRIMEPELHYEGELSEAEKAALKAYFFAIFNDRQCYIPLTVWKATVKVVIRLSGTKRRLRASDPAFLEELERGDRPTLRGSELRHIVMNRFEQGLAHVAA